MGLLAALRALAADLTSADVDQQPTETGSPSLFIDGALGSGGALWTRARTLVRAAGAVATAFSEPSIDPTTGGINVTVVGGSGPAGAATSANQTNGTQIANPSPSTPSSSTALEASRVLKASAGTFRSLFIEVDATAPTATYYALLGTGSATVPVDGAVTLLRPPITVNHTNGIADGVTFDEGDAGIAFTVGCWACLSSTQFTKTAAGAYGLFSGSVR